MNDTPKDEIPSEPDALYLEWAKDDGEISSVSEASGARVDTEDRRVEVVSDTLFLVAKEESET
jgi:hypothetical protein